MIISHKYRFIFLKTNKTAGTSIEIALARFCGDRDIIAPITPEDEMVKKNLGYSGAQNYFATLTEYTPADLARLLMSGKKKQKYYSHIHAQDVRKYIGEKIWISYYKFCFERNPWDRVISFYYWRFQDEPRPSITEFLETEAPLLLRKNGYYLYTIDGEVAVDKVCQYEKLQEELEDVRLRLGIPEKLVLPAAKSTFRKDRRHYREILTDEHRKKIAEMFSEEIALYGYEF